VTCLRLPGLFNASFTVAVVVNRAVSLPDWGTATGLTPTNLTPPHALGLVGSGVVGGSLWRVAGAFNREQVVHSLLKLVGDKLRVETGPRTHCEALPPPETSSSSAPDRAPLGCAGEHEVRQGWPLGALGRQAPPIRVRVLSATVASCNPPTPCLQLTWSWGGFGEVRRPDQGADHLGGPRLLGARLSPPAFLQKSSPSASSPAFPPQDGREKAKCTGMPMTGPSQASLPAPPPPGPAPDL
jgi:hypothetical protein